MISPVSALLLVGWFGVVLFGWLEICASSGAELLFGWFGEAVPSGAVLLFGSINAFLVTYVYFSIIWAVKCVDYCLRCH